MLKCTFRKWLSKVLVMTLLASLMIISGTASAAGTITNLSVNDTANAADWSIQSNLQAGNTVYGDRTFLFSSVDSSVAGADWIRTANDSKAYTADPLVTFTVTRDADVYVAFNDMIATKPSWLAGWSDTGADLVDNESTPRTFSLYKKSFTANSTVSLGNNGDTSNGMYIVIVKSTAAVNLALNKSYASSGSWSSSYTSPNAFDGDMTTRWVSTQGSTNDVWLRVDFGANTTYDQVVLYEYNAHVTSFKLQSSNNDTDYTDIADTNGTTIGTSKAVSFSPVTSRYLRLYVVTAIADTNIYEMEVYNTGSAGPTPTVTPTPTPTVTPTSTPSATPHNVKTYGAKGDGSTDDTTAINNAISAANAAGGGTVLFPSGTYSSKSIRLKNNVTLYLDGATLKARSGIDAPEANPYDDYQDFGHSHFHNALIWGENLNNIKIMGKGTIDGNGYLSTSDSPGSGQGDKAISLKLCTNVEIGGLDASNRLTMTKFGHFAMLITGCDKVDIHDIFVPNVTSGQRDFLDIMQCNDVTVTNIESLYTNDDTIKLGSDYSLGFKRPSSNIVVKNVKAKTNCNVLMIGSETVAPISNVSFSDITVLGAGKAGLGIMSNDGSVVDGVTLTNCTMTGTTSPVYIKITNRGRCPNPSIGRIRNVTISNVTAVNCESGNGEYTATIAGYKEGTTIVDVENVTLNSVKITAKGGHPTSDASITPPELTGGDYNLRYLGTRPAYGWWMRYVTGIRFLNGCSVGFESTDGRYAVVVDDGNGVEFDGFTMQKGSSPRVQIKNGCANFYMHNCPNLPDDGPINISGAKTY